MALDREFDAKPVKLADLMQPSFFVIPRYQRPYSWERRQWQDLWDDIADSIDHEQQHYLGTVVLRATEENVSDRKGRSFRRFAIVDGQQRLTSIALYALALSEHLGDAPRSEGIWEDFIKYEDNLRITPGEANREYYTSLVDALERGVSIPTPQSSSNRLLASAYDHYLDRFEAMKNARGAEFLVEISETLRNDLRILPFVTRDRPFAIKMFQTVNDRGKPISLLDKTKGFLMFYQAKYLPGQSELLDRTEEAFGNIFLEYDRIKELGEEYEISYIKNPSYQFSEKEFLRFAYHYIFKVAKREFGLQGAYEYDIKAEGVFQEFIKANCETLQEDEDRLQGFISTIIDSLNKVSVALAQLIDEVSEAPEEGNVAQLLRWQGASAAVYPLLINAKADDKLDEMMLELVRVLDMRVYKIRGTEPKAKLYRQGVVAVGDDEKSIENVHAAIRRFIQKYGSDAEINRRLHGDMYSNRYSRYLLWEWAMGKADERDESSYELFRSVHREHILPQDPKKFDFTDYDFEDEADYVGHRHMLGNLCVLEKAINSEGSNKPPREKVGGYQKSGLRATRVLGGEIHETGFQKEQINERTESIAQFVLEHWAVPQADEKRVSDGEEEEMGARVSEDAVAIEAGE